MPAREDQVKGTGKKLTKKHGAVTSPAVPDSAPSSIPPVLLGDLRSLIESARVRVAVGVNALTGHAPLAYWSPDS